MEHATRVILPPDKRLASPSRTITLTRENRYRRRVVLTTDCGDDFLLNLAEATYMPEGSGLTTDGGNVIIIRAAAEPLLEVTADSQLTLSRIAWHIGNRHTPAEMTGTAIYIQPDHVLADMVQGLGGTVSEIKRPFEPEGGAYGGHGSLEHGHHHHAHGHTASHSGHGHHTHHGGHTHNEQP